MCTDAPTPSRALGFAARSVLVPNTGESSSNFIFGISSSTSASSNTLSTSCALSVVGHARFLHFLLPLNFPEHRRELATSDPHRDATDMVSLCARTNFSPIRSGDVNPLITRTGMHLKSRPQSMKSSSPFPCTRSADPSAPTAPSPSSARTIPPLDVSHSSSAQSDWAVVAQSLTISSLPTKILSAAWRSHRQSHRYSPRQHLLHRSQSKEGALEGVCSMEAPLMSIFLHDCAPLAWLSLHVVHITSTGSDVDDALGLFAMRKRSQQLPAASLEHVVVVKLQALEATRDNSDRCCDDDSVIRLRSSTLTIVTGTVILRTRIWLD